MTFKNYFYIAYDPDSKLYKMGATSNVKGRLRALRKTHPNLDYIHLSLYKVRGEAFAFERAMKDKFHSYNIHGEWFNLPDNIDLTIENKVKKFKTTGVGRLVRLLDERYSEAGGFCTFIKIIEHGEWGCVTEAAIHFGITKERARQIAEKIRSSGFFS
jgi:hypothetical protein